MVIDTNDKKSLDEYEEKLRLLISEKKERAQYESSDIVLVKVFECLPNNSLIYASCNVPFLTIIDDLSSKVVFDILKENEQKISGNAFLDNEKLEELLKKSKDYSPLSTIYNSTVSFTLNGISSDKGSIVVVEPFKHHDDDNNILAVRADETFFRNGIALSEDSVLLLPVEYKDKIYDININCVFYNGNRDVALNMYLVSIGIIPEKIVESHIEESETSQLLYQFIAEKKYRTERYYYHPLYAIDDERSHELWKYYDEKFYTYLFRKIYPVGTHLNDFEVLKNARNVGLFYDKAYSILKNIVFSLGLSEYKKIVEQYNNQLSEELSRGEYPTNNEILGLKPVDIEIRRKQIK